MSASDYFQHASVPLTSSVRVVRTALARRRLLRKERGVLQRYAGAFSGETVICVGNGPSLREDDVAIIGQYPFVATNRAYQLFDENCFAFGGRGVLIVNDDNRCLEMLPGLSDKIKNVVFSTYTGETFFEVSALRREAWAFAPAKWRLRRRRAALVLGADGRQCFSPQFDRVYFPGWSVIFSAIQFAYYLGAARIVLIGCDMEYSGKKQYSDLIKEERFGIGHIGEFDYAVHGRPHMLACRQALVARGVELVNATPGGAIDEVPRVRLSLLAESCR